MDENINEILDLYFKKHPDAVDISIMPEYYEKEINFEDAVYLVKEAYKKNKYFKLEWDGSKDPDADIMVLKNG
tara:strand:- start:537 stop:755 length:219 start_codon:yes stop_codon:yes gene_type:complete